MPLTRDGRLRGVSGIHVKRHKKLGQHRTIAKSTWSLVNWLIDHPDVNVVHLGKIGYSQSESTIQCRVDGRNVHLLLRGDGSAQVIRLSIKPTLAFQQSQLEDFLAKIEQIWTLGQSET